jgi:hypothetical protein
MVDSELMNYGHTLDIVTEVWKCLCHGIKQFNQSADRQELLYPRTSEAVQKTPDWPAASERAIGHRLAVYLELAVRAAALGETSGSLAVDCEYNRHCGAKKAQAVECNLKSIVEKARMRKLSKTNEHGAYLFSIAPDIVVHKRGTDIQNLLVVELKKASVNANYPELLEYDKLKLQLFTRRREREEGYGYLVGALVVAQDDCVRESRRLRIEQRFERGEPRHTPTW